MTYTPPPSVQSRIEDRDGDGGMLAYAVPAFLVVAITIWLPIVIIVKSLWF